MNGLALQIGEVATRSGVSVDTVRYYERRHLINRAPRTTGGFRLFPVETVERIQFIKQAQELGFSLDEIRGILTNGGGVSECQRVRDLLRAKLTELDERMEVMKNFHQTLTQYLVACEHELEEHGQKANCPVVTTIERTGQSPKVIRKETSNEAQN